MASLSDRTVIFDLDGTLIDSLPDVQIALNHALTEFGYASLSMAAIKKMVGGGALPLVQSALAAVDGDRVHASAITQSFKNYYSANPVDKTTIYPSVVEVLEELQARGLKLGICTNKPEATTYPVLDKLNLRRFFGSIICGDTFDYKKPDPRHLWGVIEELGGDRLKSVYVGDSDTDVKGARAAGLPVFLVSYGYAHRPLSELNADRVVDTFEEVLRAIDELLDPLVV